MPKDIYQSPYRTYRLDTINHKNEQKIQIIIEETDLLITLTDSINKEEIIDFCSKEIREQRNILKFWINLYPEIKDSLDPIPAPKNAPLLISAMCEAGKYAHVGPFAAVAGTIAQYIATTLHEYLQKKIAALTLLLKTAAIFMPILPKNGILELWQIQKKNVWWA